MSSPRRSSSMSASVVCGVIRSTMQLGKATLPSIQSASSGSLIAAWETTAVRATFPLPGRLSQLITVNGGVPSARRRRSASTMYPKAVVGSPGWVASWTAPGLKVRNSPVTSSTL